MKTWLRVAQLAGLLSVLVAIPALTLLLFQPTPPQLTSAPIVIPTEVQPGEPTTPTGGEIQPSLEAPSVTQSPAPTPQGDAGARQPARGSEPAGHRPASGNHKAPANSAPVRTTAPKPVAPKPVAPKPVAPKTTPKPVTTVKPVAPKPVAPKPNPGNDDRDDDRDDDAGDDDGDDD